MARVDADRNLLFGLLDLQNNFIDRSAGYEGPKAREAKIPAPSKPRLTDAADRVVQLHEDWSKKEKAAEWRARLARPAKPAP